MWRMKFTFITLIIGKSKPNNQLQKRMKEITTLIAISFIMHAWGQCTMNEQEYKDYFKQNIATLDEIEGIWSVSSTLMIYQNGELSQNFNDGTKFTRAIFRANGDFKGCSLNSDTTSNLSYRKTAVKGFYLVERFREATHSITTSNAVISSGGFMKYSVKVPTEQVGAALRAVLGDKNFDGVSMVNEVEMVKTFPLAEDIQKLIPIVAPQSAWSGTGFAISSNGFVVTNHHVVNDAKSIKVRGINSDFSKSYHAKVIVDDKNNDLAIIQIDDSAFTTLGTIPYIIPYKSCDVGCSIFCLGYPLLATMGEEVKLTNGIISSKSGFQGDITTYQISAPIQPGNSGGPLFDDKGNLIGIVNARHIGAENVSYAIKVSYLLNLIDIMPIQPKLQTVSLLNGKSLPEQVKLVKNFTYIIDVNQ